MDRDAVVLLPNFLNRIYVNDGHVEVTQLVEELVIDLSCYRVPLSHRQLRGDRHVELCPQPVAQPPRPDLRYLFHAGDVACGVSDLVYDLRLHPIEEPGEDRLS